MPVARGNQGKADYQVVFGTKALGTRKRSKNYSPVMSLDYAKWTAADYKKKHFYAKVVPYKKRVF